MVDHAVGDIVIAQEHFFNHVHNMKFDAHWLILSHAGGLLCSRTGSVDLFLKYFLYAFFQTSVNGQDGHVSSMYIGSASLPLFPGCNVTHVLSERSITISILRSCSRLQSQVPGIVCTRHFRIPGPTNASADLCPATYGLQMSGSTSLQASHAPASSASAYIVSRMLLRQ